MSVGPSQELKGGGEVGGAALVRAEQGPSPPDDILRNTIKDLWPFIEKG